MTRHLIRLIWNRKRHNVLLAVEILFSFLVLFAVVLLTANSINNWRQPLGFNIARVWRINVDRKERDQDPTVRARHQQTFRQLFATLADMPGVELAAGANISPYSNTGWGQDVHLEDGRTLQYGANLATDAFRDLFQLQVVFGRWFSREDDAATVRPVVINQRLARDIFGEGNAVGQIIPEKQEPNRSGEFPEAKRVIGVIEDFRKEGELATPEGFLFYRARIDVGAASFSGSFSGPEWPGVLLLVRVAPGTTAAFEETLIKRLQTVARDWSFEVKPLVAERESKLRQYTVPLITIATLAGFLLLMVALGLTGVVWQSVTERTREFGLRRANGATVVNVRRQVLVELTIMSTMALIGGVVLVGQLPLLPLPPDVWVFPSSVFITSVIVSVAAIYALTLLCGWYPSRLATRIRPAEALHYE